MNRYHGRLEYLTNGHFSSERRRWQWLETLAGLPRLSNDEDDDEEGYDNCDDEEEAEQVNFIWSTLRKNPELIRTEPPYLFFSFAGGRG
jgi:hypothetical protein